ncbi:GntR family transcriptional regulator [Burkholderia sp. WAC0059]|nr:GntR family transcriptional regulator [Burkholderia sp. WAC0059]
MNRPAARVSLVDSAAEILRERISGGLWKVGDKLPIEPELATLLGVSRGTVRAAVRSLAVAGLLDVRQGAGTFVASTTERSAELKRLRRTGLRSQFEVRRALEVEAMRLAAVRATAREIRQIDSLLEKRGHWLGIDSDNARFVADDYQFHFAIVRSAHNPALLETYEFLSLAVNETIASTLEVDIPEPDYDAHRSLIEAIESRSPDAAEAAVRDFMDFILAALPEVPRQ